MDPELNSEAGMSPSRINTYCTPKSSSDNSTGQGLHEKEDGDSTRLSNIVCFAASFTKYHSETSGPDGLRQLMSPVSNHINSIVASPNPNVKVWAALLANLASRQKAMFSNLPLYKTSDEAWASIKENDVLAKKFGLSD